MTTKQALSIRQRIARERKEKWIVLGMMIATAATLYVPLFFL